ncbi:MAG: HNH endonuclease family protein [Gordonia sp. (in: high G+C Gram-positive bacteria)]
MHSTIARTWPTVAAIVVLVGVLGGCSAPGTETTATNTTATPGTSTPGTGRTDPSGPATSSTPAGALAALAALPVRGRAPTTGYRRDQFGSSWTDDVTVAGGHNGCDTRNDILRRDLVDVVVKPRTHDCVVLSGTLPDPYSGQTVDFVRGAQTSSRVQIDHVVALADAWQKGAQQLTREQRTDLANDPRNLQATIGTINQRKGAGDAATWLPPSRAYRCTYATRQIQVKAAYRLWVTAAERDALARILHRCPAGGP